MLDNLMRWALSALGAASQFTLKSIPSTASCPAQYSLNTRWPNQTAVQQELGAHLSKNASIYFPDDPQFAESTMRWSAAASPDFKIVVVPGTEHDVAETVKFANKHNIPFLAVNRGHGTASSLSNVKHGINIYVRALDSIEIAEDGNSAFLGGGTRAEEVIQHLSAHGKVTSTGGCACVGMMGAGLGGGFSRYQGFFGLIVDNIISMRVVIANGSLITVSASSHPDLYWGMRGAGHNFGIVTSFEHRIYEQPVVEWFVQTMIFSGDVLEEFFERMNELGANGEQPREMVTYALFAMVPELSATEPMIIATFEYAGPPSSASPYLHPFTLLHPLLTTSRTVPYPLVASATLSGLSDFACQPGLSWHLFPVGLQIYNSSANRLVYELFREMVRAEPVFNRSIVQFEGYAMQGVRTVESESTAYAHRGDNLLVSFDPIHPPSTALDELALGFGRRARALIHSGAAPGYPLNTYVNYVSSADETPEMMYGYEAWRLERLKGLKGVWDEGGRVGWYGGF